MNVTTSDAATGEHARLLSPVRTAVNQGGKLDIYAVVKKAGVPLSLADAVITFAAGENYGCAPLITKTSAGGGIEITDIAGGRFTIHLLKNDTDINFDYPTELNYDVRVSYPDESAIVLYGTIRITPRLT
jgi:hypothetical protein